MPGTRACRSALVLLMGAAMLALPTAAHAESAPPAPAPPAPIAPAPFAMPMDTGPRMTAQQAQAQADLATYQPQLTTATAERAELQDRWNKLTAHLVELDALRTQARSELEAARARLSASAARAYKESGGTRVNAALDAMREANDLLDMSRDLHLISKYGDYEMDVVEQLEGKVRNIEKQILAVSSQRADVKAKIDDANSKVTALQSLVDSANQRLAEAQAELAKFQMLATTAGSPIMGPSRLTAPQLAAFLVAHYEPHVSVTVDELATYYIEEGVRYGIRGDVAFAQSILETGGFNFGGSMVEIPDNNYAGIGACDSCNRGFLFPDARSGVRAQMQLLRTYVDRTFDAETSPDPLFLPGTLKLGFRGRVQSWWDLTGTWATAHDYGIRLYELYQRIVAEADAATAAAAAAAAAAPPPAP
jgi:Mannosyl-glycoprotein endo-beta-N-acetylglucosaminidase